MEEDEYNDIFGVTQALCLISIMFIIVYFILLIFLIIEIIV